MSRRRDCGVTRLGQADWIRAAAERFERPLLVYARNLLGDAHKSRDIVQEAFLELCRCDRAAVEPKLGPWLFTVCRRRVIDLTRKEKRMTALGTDPPARLADPVRPLEVRDSARVVLDRLAALPANQQEVVRLRFLQGFSYREIAGVTGLTVSHVGVLLHTALKTLRQALPELEGSV